MLPRVGVIVDLDGTLVVESDRDWDDPTLDPCSLLEDVEQEPVYSEVKAWERKHLNVDVVYLTGRSQKWFIATKVWLSQRKLHGKLICRPTNVQHTDVSAWKAQTVAALKCKHRWSHVTVYENNATTLMAIKCVLPPHTYSPTLVQAETEVPESNLTGLSEQDIVNFKILMGRLAPDDPSWQALLLRKWPSRTALLDRAQDFISGKHKRRLFRQMVDEIWNVAA